MLLSTPVVAWLELDFSRSWVVVDVVRVCLFSCHSIYYPTTSISYFSLKSSLGCWRTTNRACFFPRFFLAAAGWWPRRTAVDTAGAAAPARAAAAEEDGKPSPPLAPKLYQSSTRTAQVQRESSAVTGGWPCLQWLAAQDGHGRCGWYL